MGWRRNVCARAIARVGATGNATGTHCHFEIRHDNLAIDPRKYLPASTDADEIYAAGGPSQAPSLQRERTGLASGTDPIP